MCVNKLRILNPGYSPTDFYSRRFIEVSCGHCWQCQQERVNSISFRMIQEVSQPGVIPFFVTFTYAPEYRTILHYQLVGEPPRQLSVWNRQHFQRLLKNVRRQLQYYYGVGSNSFKYLCTCERGVVDEYVDDYGRLRKGQKAPHLHSIFLLYSGMFGSPVRELPPAFLDYCKSQVLAPDYLSFFRWLLNTKWIYGHVDDIAFARDIVASVRYVCKYINKNHDDPFYKIPLSSYLEIQDKEFDIKNKRAIEQHLRCPHAISNTDIAPRSCASVNLGISFVESLDLSSTLNYLSGRSKVTLPGVKCSSQINLPNYFYNKLCKSVTKLHYNRIYTRRFNNFDSFGTRPVYTYPLNNYKDVFNNVVGHFREATKKVYTASTLTQLGVFVRRNRFLSAFRSIRDFISGISSQFDYYRKLFNQYTNLKPVFQTCLHYFDYPLVSISNFSLSDYISVLRGQNGIKYDTYCFAKVCQFMCSHYDHLARERVYKQGLASAAYDNPDLFTNHFI